MVQHFGTAYDAVNNSRFGKSSDCWPRLCRASVGGCIWDDAQNDRF